MSEFTQIMATRAEPVLTVYESGKGRLSAPAVERWFDDVEAVELYTDDEGQLGIAAAPGGGTHRLHGDGDGRGVSVAGALSELGIEYMALDAPVTVPLAYDPDEGLAIADVTAVREAVVDE